jgi:hypothetical protein
VCTASVIAATFRIAVIEASRMLCRHPVQPCHHGNTRAQATARLIDINIDPSRPCFSSASAMARELKR